MSNVPRLLSIYYEHDMFNEAFSLLDEVGKECLDKIVYLKIQLRFLKKADFLEGADSKKYKDKILDICKQLIPLTSEGEQQLEYILCIIKITHDENYKNKALDICERLIKHSGSEQDRLKYVSCIFKITDDENYKNKVLDSYEQLIKLAGSELERLGYLADKAFILAVNDDELHAIDYYKQVLNHLDNQEYSLDLSHLENYKFSSLREFIYYNALRTKAVTGLIYTYGKIGNSEELFRWKQIYDEIVDNNLGLSVTLLIKIYFLFFNYLTT